MTDERKDKEPVLLEIQESIAIITLNRPENRNSMDGEVLPVFQANLARIRADRNLRCLIITGSGNTFCGGADFKAGLDDVPGRPMHEILLSLYQPFLDVADIEIPTIAAMNGHAVGGGFGLALLCDLRIANLAARYGANFARLGIHAGMGITYLLPRLVGLPAANRMLFTGRLISGRKAEEIGLVNEAVDEQSVLTRALDLAAQIAASAPAAVRLMKQSVYQGLGWNPRGTAEREAKIQALTMTMDDAREGITALLEKRKPEFKGS